MTTEAVAEPITATPDTLQNLPSETTDSATQSGCGSIISLLIPVLLTGAAAIFHKSKEN